MPKQAAVSPEQFQAWCDAMGFTLNQAADALGIGPDTAKNYSSGRGKVPLVAALAMSALYHRIKPWPL